MGNSSSYFKRPPVKEGDEGEVSKILNLSMPSMYGTSLVLMSYLLKFSFIRNIVLNKFIRDIGLDTFLHTKLMDLPLYLPLHPFEGEECKFKDRADPKDFIKLDVPFEACGPNQIMDFYNAYRDGSLTPHDVAENVIKQLEKLKSFKPHVYMFTDTNYDHIRQQADESTERFRKNAPLSVLDGVPFCVKALMKVKGYKSMTFCTTVLFQDPQDENDYAVERLLDAGALLIGITSLHECGLGATGLTANRDHPCSRSAFRLDRAAGGSSGGTASAVISGICPFGLGTDGGGSIRIPAAINALVGLKPTFGRCIQDTESSPVVVAGPLTHSVLDSLLVYSFIAGPSHLRSDIHQFRQPIPRLCSSDLFVKGDLPANFKIGIDSTYIKQGSKDEHFSSVCIRTAKHLRDEKGVSLMDIQLPEMTECTYAGLIEFFVSIGYEMGHADFRKNIDQYCPTNHTLLYASECLPGDSYVIAAQQRTRNTLFMKKIFEKVDCLLLPAIGIGSPRIKDAYLSYGYSDLETDLSISRFTMWVNVLGLPAMVVPIGISPTGDALSVQIIAPWWREDVLFQVGRAIETIRMSFSDDYQFKPDLDLSVMQ